jgi:hypothetical protein
MCDGLPNLRLPEAPGIRNAPTLRQRPDDAETPPAQFHLPTTRDERGEVEKIGEFTPRNVEIVAQKIRGDERLRVETLALFTVTSRHFLRTRSH